MQHSLAVSQITVDLASKKPSLRVISVQPIESMYLTLEEARKSEIRAIYIRSPCQMPLRSLRFSAPMQRILQNEATTEKLKDRTSTRFF